jgi:WD40 repeat protein
MKVFCRWVLLCSIGFMIFGSRPLLGPVHAATLPYIALSRPERGKVFAVAWSPDSKYIAAGTETGIWLYTAALTDVTHVADQAVHALAWSSDGKTIAAGYFGQQSQKPITAQQKPDVYPIQGGGIKLWTLTDSNSITLTGDKTLIHDGSVYALRFSPDGHFLASESEDSHVYYEDVAAENGLRIFDVDTKTLKKAFPATRQFVLQDGLNTIGANTLAWSHDGHYLAASSAKSISPSDDGGLLIWNATTDQDVTPALDSYEPRSGINTAIAWNRNDTQFAVSGMPSNEPDSSGSGGICSLSGALDDQNQVPCILFRDQIDPIQEGQDTSIPVLAWRNDGKLIAYSNNKVIKIADSSAYQLVATLDAAFDNVTMLDWSPDGTALLSAGSDYVIRVWSRFANYQTPIPKPIRSETIAASSDSNIQSQFDVLSPNDQLLARLNPSTGLITVTNQQNGKKFSTFKPTNINLSAISKSKQGSPPVGPESDPFSSALLMRWSPDSALLAVGTETIQIWSASTGKLINDLSANKFIFWRPDSQAIAINCPNQCTVLNVITGKTIAQLVPIAQWNPIKTFFGANPDLNLRDHIFSASAWSPDGRFIAFNDDVQGGSYQPAAVYVWDTTTSQIVATLNNVRSTFGGSGNSADVLTWGGNGQTILIEGFQNTYLYHLDTASNPLRVTLLWQYPNAQGKAVSSPDGLYLLWNGTIYDAHNGWPMFRFASNNYYDYQWTSAGLKLFIQQDNGRKAVTYRVGDLGLKTMP